MPKFDKKFVHFMWSDELKGKKCFLSDYIGELKSVVEQQDEMYIDTIIDEYSPNYPFNTKVKGFFALAYYDPYYELKVAEEQGKTIQYLVKVMGGERWEDVHEPVWNDVPECYRIKPDEPNGTVTNRELARWLAQGKGEFAYLTEHGTYIDCYNSINYSYDTDNWDVQDNIRVRKWEDTEWHTPTRKYMGLEE